MSDKDPGREEATHLGEIKLVGVNHIKEVGSSEPPKDNYAKVKTLLEQEKPSFVTLEVPLFRQEIKMWFADPLTADNPRLNQIEQNMINYPQHGEEFFAAIIYCKRTNTPLYFIDLWSNDPKEVAKHNLTADPSAVVGRGRAVSLTVSQENEADKIENRNKFMGEALQIIRLKYAGKDGVHVGGIQHYDNGNWSLNKLQDFLTGKVKVHDLSS